MLPDSWDLEDADLEFDSRTHWGAPSLVLDTMAVALYRAGDLAGAVAMEEKAIKELEAQVPNKSHPYYKSFPAQLETFKAAAEKAGKAGKP